MIVIRSLGWLCLFNSLGCCNVQEAAGWRGAVSGEAPKFHTPPSGWMREGETTGAENVDEVLHQITPVELEPEPSGQSSQEGVLYHSQKFQWYIVHEKNQTRQLQERAGSHRCLPIRFSIFNHHFLSMVGLGELCSTHKAVRGDLFLIMDSCITNE